MIPGDIRGSKVDDIVRAIDSAIKRTLKHEQAQFRHRTYIRTALVRYVTQHIYLNNKSAEFRAADAAHFHEDLRYLLKTLPDGLPPKELSDDDA